MNFFKSIKNDYLQLLCLLFPVASVAIAFIGERDPVTITLLLGLASLTLLILIVRSVSINSALKNADEVSATITSVSFYRDRGTVYYTYRYEGEDFRGKTAIMKNRLTKQFGKGAVVDIAVKTSNHKKSYIKCLYCSGNFEIRRLADADSDFQTMPGIAIPSDILDKIMEEIKAETMLKRNRFIFTGGEAGLFDSKLGGLPYIPSNEDFPYDSNGHQMRLLVQLNLTIMPTLENFPSTGLLQFFIADDDMFGLDFDNPSEQKNFRIRYYEQPDTSITEDSVRAKYKEPDKESITPICRENSGIIVKSEEKPITLNDYRFDSLFMSKLKGYLPDCKIESVFDINQGQYDKICDSFGYSDGGTHTGGYADFTQTDPREDKTEEAAFYDTLLLQLDSNGYENYIMFGDCGIANFFINSKALKEKDFSKVLYNWDCY